MTRLSAWIAGAVLVGAILAAMVDPESLPFVGQERISAVFLLDGQAYFGHLDDDPFSDMLVLRDVYYVNDASKVTTDLPIGLVKRGNELHQPADVMYIRRDKVLGIERVTLGSPIGKAIAAQRARQRRDFAHGSEGSRRGIRVADYGNAGAGAPEGGYRHLEGGTRWKPHDFRFLHLGQRVVKRIGGNRIGDGIAGSERGPADHREQLVGTVAGEDHLRWHSVKPRGSGDEFVAVLDCAPGEAEARVQRIRKWVFGDYPVGSADAKRKVAVDGAIGIAGWRPGQSAAQLFAEADRAMFHDKHAPRA